MTGKRVGERVVIPLFPLGTVLVPGLVLPLHVFEPRYRQLVADLHDRPEEDRYFGVVAIREGRETGVDGVTALHAVGTTAVLRTVTPYDDGRSDLVTSGDARFRLHTLVLDAAPYLCGEVEWLPEPDGDEAAVLGDAVTRRFAAYRAALHGTRAVEAAQLADLPDEPRPLSYLVAAAMVLDLHERQALLEAPDTSTRLRAELALLGRETGLLQRLPSLPAVELARVTTGLN